MSTLVTQFKSFPAFLLAIMISSCASTGNRIVGPPLTGAEIKKLIDGNTIQGPLGREMYDWYYQSNGQVTGVVGASDDDSGTWEIKDTNIYCHEWDQYFDGVRLCYEWYKLERSGAYVMRNVDADRAGDIEVWEVILGNPYNM